jgi:hypothetical protein
MTDPEQLFKDFISQHCEVSAGTWIQLKLLHAAFGAYCVNCGCSRAWLSDHFVDQRDKTGQMAAGMGAKLKGTNNYIVVVGLTLKTFP